MKLRLLQCCSVRENTANLLHSKALALPSCHCLQKQKHLKVVYTYHQSPNISQNIFVRIILCFREFGADDQYLYFQTGQMLINLAGVKRGKTLLINPQQNCNM